MVRAYTYTWCKGKNRFESAATYRVNGYHESNRGINHGIQLDILQENIDIGVHASMNKETTVAKQVKLNGATPAML